MSKNSITLSFDASAAKLQLPARVAISTATTGGSPLDASESAFQAKAKIHIFSDHTRPGAAQARHGSS